MYALRRLPSSPCTPYAFGLPLSPPPPPSQSVRTFWMASRSMINWITYLSITISGCGNKSEVIITSDLDIKFVRTWLLVWHVIKEKLHWVLFWVLDWVKFDLDKFSYVFLFFLGCCCFVFFWIQFTYKKTVRETQTLQSATSL